MGPSYCLHLQHFLFSFTTHFSLSWFVAQQNLLNLHKKSQTSCHTYATACFSSPVFTAGCLIDFFPPSVHWLHCSYSGAYTALSVELNGVCMTGTMSLSVSLQHKHISSALSASSCSQSTIPALLFSAVRINLSPLTENNCKANKLSMAHWAHLTVESEWKRDRKRERSLRTKHSS